MHPEQIGQAYVFCGSCGEMLRSRGQEEPKQKNERMIVTTGADSLSTYARKHAHKLNMQVDGACEIAGAPCHRFHETALTFGP
jgi:hypothetical protein